MRLLTRFIIEEMKKIVKNNPKFKKEKKRIRNVGSTHQNEKIHLDFCMLEIKNTITSND